MKVLISAGPTREKIDAVRFLSNRSTGKMGYALAEAARRLGHRVVLVAGPVNLPDPAGISVIHVESAAEMADAIHAEAADSGLIVMAAAVEFERTEDILASLGKRKRPGQLLVGFAAETTSLIAYASEKLARKNLDWIAANDVSRSDIGFGSDRNAVTLLGSDGSRFEIGPAPKFEVALELLRKITEK